MRQVWLGSVGPYLFDDADFNGLTTGGDVVAANFEGTGLSLGTINPSTPPGVAAPPGALFGRNNAGVGELWLKTGVANTSWTQITVP